MTLRLLRSLLRYWYCRALVRAVGPRRRRFL
jgi:hypothetical protein